MGNKLKDQDLFGQKFRMKLDAGKDDLRSIIGSLCSLILISVLCMFAVLKFEVLINKKDVDIMSTINDNFFTPDDQVTSANGINISAALTKYDDETEDILDPTYGEIVFMRYFWGTQEDGEYKSGREKLSSQHKCTSDELGLGDTDKAKFYPMDKKNRGFIEKYQKKFHCIDPEDLYVYGDWNSDKSSFINVQL